MNLDQFHLWKLALGTFYKVIKEICDAKCKVPMQYLIHKNQQLFHINDQQKTSVLSDSVQLNSHCSEDGECVVMTKKHRT